MITRKYSWITMAISVLALFFLISMAQADEPYDLTMCMSGEGSTLLASKELVIYNFRADGMTMSNHENKAFHGMSYRCIGTSKIVNGVRHGVSYCKYMDADGDLVVGEGIRTEKEGTWKFLYGTGKWQGITGGGPIGVTVASGKPISEGTFQICQRAKGTFDLP
jgi:hypothetical protein